jgi:hypothetical protein
VTLEGILHGPARQVVAGAALFGCAALPITPEGESFVQLLGAAFSRDLLEGAMMLVGLGSPFLFGLAAAGAAVAQGRGRSADYAARVALHTVLAAVHTQLMLVAFVLAWKGVGVASGALAGFALVSGVAFAWRSARDRAASDEADGGPSVRFFLRWGASVLAGVAVWSRLQVLGGVALGVAVEGVLVSALALHLAVGARARRRERAGAPPTGPDPREP